MKGIGESDLVGLELKWTQTLIFVHSVERTIKGSTVLLNNSLNKTLGVLFFSLITLSIVAESGSTHPFIVSGDSSFPDSNLRNAPVNDSAEKSDESEGCEHVKLVQSESGQNNTDDQDDSLELQQLYDKLKESHESDSQVVRTVALNLDRVNNDKQLVQGKKVPKFSLLDSEGENVSLTDILKEHEFVLIDFWASWCGPCIETFPKLTALHSDYRADGFEIVTISIDESIEDWKRSSVENEIGWSDLHDKEGFFGEAAVAYGVSSIPKSFLVDKEGCILQKNISPDELATVLQELRDKNSAEVKNTTP